MYSNHIDLKQSVERSSQYVSIVDTLTWSRDVDAATNDLDLLSDMQDVLGEEGVVLLDERIDLSRHK